MRIKLNTSVASQTWSLKKGQIVEANNFKQSARWLADGTASLVDTDTELETAALPRTYKKK